MIMMRRTNNKDNIKNNDKLKIIAKINDKKIIVFAYKPTFQLIQNNQKNNKKNNNNNTDSPPKSCIPNRAKMTMKRKRRKSKDTMLLILLSSEITKFLKEDQYLVEKKMSGLIGGWVADRWVERWVGRWMADRCMEIM